MGEGAVAPARWSHDLGFVLGALSEGGWISPTGSPEGLAVVFQKTQAEAIDLVRTALQTWFGPARLAERTTAHTHQLTCDSPAAHAFFHRLGLAPFAPDQKRVPWAIWSAPREAVIGFLQGLFTTGGAIHVKSSDRSCTVHLISRSPRLLEEIQLLLLNLGIASKVQGYHRGSSRSVTDRKGDPRIQTIPSDFELTINKTNRDRFLEVVGFIDAAHQEQARAFVASQVHRSQREDFIATVTQIEDAGQADVYDLTEPYAHSLIANGLVAHNCGEQWLGAYENCCLGSVNLATCLGPGASVDWDKLARDVTLATRFLDDVIDANQYVPSVPALARAAHRARRIGLGVMGLGDLMYHCGIRYGSPAGQEFAAQVIEFVRYQAMRASIALAEARGAFPAFEGSIYWEDPQAVNDPHSANAQKHTAWTPPTPLAPYTRDFGRPVVDWNEITTGIRAHGIRNAAQTTIAPTGTIATVAGCEGYGCEPVFALAYVRHVNDKGKDLTLTYASPLFERALEQAGIDPARRKQIFEAVMETGSCQPVSAIPPAVRDAFVVSSDISASEHVYMQAAMQAFVDNSLSKTINFPPGASEEDVATAYRLAWKLGCKGITVYVTGSRDVVVLETKATAAKKAAPVQPVESAHSAPAAHPASEASQPAIWHDLKKPRPRCLSGHTYSIDTPLGKAFITINENGGSQPFEVFVNTSKAGSETAAVSESLGRLVSYILRLASPVEPSLRLNEVYRQLAGIGGGRSLGFGPNRVRSLPDGLAQALGDYLEQRTARLQAEPAPSAPPTALPAVPTQSPAQPLLKIGDLCPECGQAAVVNEEGCRKCYACGYSEC